MLRKWTVLCPARKKIVQRTAPKDVKIIIFGGNISPSWHSQALFSSLNFNSQSMIIFKGVLLPILSQGSKASTLLKLLPNKMAQDIIMASNRPVDDSASRNTIQIPGIKTKKRPFFIGVAGGTCCGKSEVCKKILKDLGQTDLESEKRKVMILSQESFYRDLTAEEFAQANAGNFNFDHPGAFDDQLCLETLQKLHRSEQAIIQEYSFKKNTRETEGLVVHPADVILFEGILVLYNKEIRQLLDMKIFVDTDSDTRLARRVLRDIDEHGRDIDNVLNQYTRFVKPAFEDFTLPTKKYADVIIPRGADNTVAIDLIVQHIKDLLNNSSNENIKKRTRHQSETGTTSSNKIRPH